MCFEPWHSYHSMWLPNFRVARRVYFWNSNEALPKLFHRSARNTWATGWLGMAHGTSGLIKILVPRVNWRPTGRFLAILTAEISLQWNSLGRAAFELYGSQRDMRLRKLIQWTITMPGNTCCILLHYDSSKHIVHLLWINLYELPKL
jgi:hypothetical protein